MVIVFFNHIWNVLDTYSDVRKLVSDTFPDIEDSRLIPYIGIRIDYSDDIFWNYAGDNIEIENITNFHPNIAPHIKSFIDAHDECNIHWNAKDSVLNIAQIFALRSRYEMYAYAVLEILQTLYPNHIIVLEPL